MTLLLDLLLGACFLVFAVARTLRYMLFFQQEEYDGRRFITWLRDKRVIDIRLSLALLLIGIIAVLPIAYADAVAGVFAAVALLAGAYLDRRSTHGAKKKLSVTERVRRILFAVSILLVLTAALLVLLGAHPWLWILGVQAVPLLLVLAKRLLDPQEKRVQARFRAEAEQRLKQVNPRVIAITGSFGKTSVKHILAHVLALTSHTVHTPGSVNTVMGIVRIIREKLGDGTRNFVVEMGAYGPGSIGRLCVLTPPDFGIITALGAAHYERFKTLDTVARAKFELAEHTIARGGKLAISDTVLAQPYALEFVGRHRASFIIVGEGEGCDVRLLSSAQSPAGTAVTISSHGRPPVSVAVPLYGAVHGRNVALAFAAAEALGVPEESILIALKTTPPITHRLEVKRDASGATLIDDAYNSNPDGFRAALDVLDMLGRDKGGRRILVTPGMVELGEKHEAAHAEIGAYAAPRADMVLAVAPQRIPSFVASLGAASPRPEVIEVASFAQARAWLGQNLKPNDVVLIENDLPDVYEAVPRL